MKTFTINTVTVFFLLIVCSSCDKYNYTQYIIDNQTENSIKIDYTFSDYFSDNELSDSTIVLEGNQQDTLFTFLSISPSIYKKETSTELIYLTNVSVQRLTDDAEMTKPIELQENWKYIETGDNDAILEFTVKEKDF